MQPGRYPDTVAAYRVAVRLKPKEARGHYHLAVACRARGDLMAAVEEYSLLRPWMVISPNNSLLRLRPAGWLRQVEPGPYDHAQSDYPQNLLLSPLPLA